ncbi:MULTISPECIES: hypothetical protein [Sinorhizobium]|uniref:hypothetical protein n=1 Tax=Sinorhizobium TaxID=28105 RepID=UPI001F2C0834|nr:MULTISPECIES: hypothetical protein [Sinorhizobium]
MQALKKISNCAKRCWVAISIGSDLRRDARKSYYEAHPEFQLNVFYRMKAELPVDGNFAHRRRKKKFIILPQGQPYQVITR